MLIFTKVNLNKYIMSVNKVKLSSKDLENLQSDYNRITNFSSNWKKDLSVKYGLTEDELLDSIEF